jgi:hypothetical protein
VRNTLKRIGHKPRAFEDHVMSRSPLLKREFLRT